MQVILKIGREKARTSMKKTILITWSTDGIWKLVAIKLASQWHEILIHGRNPEKLDVARSEIIKTSGNDNIRSFVADFSDLDSVREMAWKIWKQIPKIDVLINNAWVYKSPVLKNKEGLNIHFVVNYLASYLLTDKLLPLIEKWEKPRIINLSSAAQAPVSLAALKWQEDISESDAYAQSKLALTMWSFDLAKNLRDISVIPVNPGSLLNTKMVQDAFGKYWSSADKWGDILYGLALSPDYEGITGKYYDNDLWKFWNAHPDAYNNDLIAQLIQATYILLQKYT